MTTQPLAEQAAISDLKKTPATRFNGERQRANLLMRWGFIIMFIGVAIGVIGKMLMHQEMVTVVGVLVSIAGMFLTAYPSLSPSPRQRNDSTSSTQPEILSPSQPDKYLPQESNIEYVPSVTEKTTDLLEISLKDGPKM